MNDVQGCQDFYYLRKSYIFKKTLETNFFASMLADRDFAGLEKSLIHFFETAAPFGYEEIGNLAMTIQKKLNSEPECNIRILLERLSKLVSVENKKFL